MEQDLPNKDGVRRLEGNRKEDETENCFYMPKHFLSEETANYEHNSNISTLEDSGSGLECIGKGSEDKDAFDMPKHFLCADITRIPLDVEQNPKNIKTEDSGRCSVDNMNILDKESFYRPEHFLLPTNADSGEGLDVNHAVGASPETLYTQTHSNDGNRKRIKYSCNICEEVFKDKRTCIRHARAHAWENKPFPCNQCEKGFDKRWFLERHLKTHEKTRDFVCSICGKDFYQKRHLIDHMNRLHNEQNPNIGTDEYRVCGLEESRKNGEKMDLSYMSTHFLSDNNTGMPLAVEENPSKTDFIQKDILDEHQLLHNSQSCKQLEKGYIKSDHLERPLKSHKQESDNDEQNPSISTNEDGDCGLEATTEDSENKYAFYMPQHFLSTNDTGKDLPVEQNPSIIKTEESDQELEDRMDDGDKEEFYHTEHFLSQKINVSDEGMDVNHVVGAAAETLYTLTHTYETGRKRVKYSCNVCEKEFKDKRQCIRHIRVHTGEKPFKCYQCGVSFGSESNLSRHIQTHTGEKPFSCPICNKHFTQKASLDSHLLLHNDMSERPFPCNQCEKGFIKRSQLERHLKTHAEIREFICTVCGKDFSEKRNLIDHTNRRHSDKVQPSCNICNREFWSEYHYRIHMQAHANNSSIETSEDQLLNSSPIIIRKEEKEIKSNTESPPIETFDTHSLFGNVLDVNVDGQGVDNDAVSLKTDTVEASASENPTCEDISILNPQV